MSVCLLMIIKKKYKKKGGGGGRGVLVPHCMLQSDIQFHFILRVCPYTECFFLWGSFCRADNDRTRCRNAEFGPSRLCHGTVNSPIIALVFLWVGDSSVVASHQP